MTILLWGMAVEPADVVSAFGVAAATIAGAIAFYNARKSVLWKRAELASSHLKELLSNEELVFACRCLDWQGGPLVVPQTLQPLLKSEGRVIEHDITVYAKAMIPVLYLDDMAKDPRLQIYRTATDTLLSWLSATESAIDRGLYTPADIKDAGYWLKRAYGMRQLVDFMGAFEYRKPLDRLATRFRIPLPGPQTRRSVFGALIWDRRPGR